MINRLGILIKGANDVQIMKNTLVCGSEALHKGEVLKVNDARIGHGFLYLYVSNVSPHAVTHGTGAFEHQSVEQGRAGIGFRAGHDGKDLDAADALAAHWFKPFDSAVDAATFGNTATSVFVNQVKAGMSFAEVEAALGVPQTRIDLGEKVLFTSTRT